jgi:hypothetical protein
MVNRSGVKRETSSGDVGRNFRGRNQRRKKRRKLQKQLAKATTDDDRASLEEQLASLASPVTMNERVETPEDSGPARRSQGGVTCCSFGRNRREKFPEYFFCHPCDLADNEPPDSKARHDPCEAGHDSFIHPTTVALTSILKLFSLL